MTSSKGLSGMRSGVSIRLLAPSLALIIGLLVAPLLLVLRESLLVFVPGHIGSIPNSPITLQNYRDLLSPSYLSFFYDTFRLSFVTSVLALSAGLPIAYFIAHIATPRTKRIWIMVLVSILFISVLVRTYAIALAAGPSGFGRELSALLGVRMNSRFYADFMIIVGLLHSVIPMVVLALLAPVRMLSPKLVDAAEVLGSPRWRAHLSITLPLAIRGLMAGFAVAFTFCISAFVIPMVLGKGRVMFVSNLIYARFGELGNYPSGAALALLLLVTSMMMIYGISAISSRFWERQ